MLTDTVPGVQVSYGMIGPLVLGLAGLTLFLGRLAIKAQRQHAATGAEGMVGRRGRVRSAIDPDAPGQIDIHGEIWRATSRVPLAAGQRSASRAWTDSRCTSSRRRQPREGDTAWKRSLNPLLLLL
jgi:membrane-bound ClpP family serine protease